MNLINSNLKGQKSYLQSPEAIADGGQVKQWNNEAIVFFFWPQYLEYAGFILLILTFAWIIRGSKS